MLPLAKIILVVIGWGSNQMSSIEPFQKKFVNSISSGSDVQPFTPVDGDKWRITRILFADKNIGDNLSGSFIVDWGVEGDRDVIDAAFLTGNTIDIKKNLTIVGDGIKEIRFIRENNSASAKKMVIIVEGHKVV